MKTVLVNYYTIEELKGLNPEGYENAYYKFAEAEGAFYNWANEAVDSVEKFLSLFDCTLRDFVIGSVYNDDYSYNDDYIYLWNDEEEYNECFEIDELSGEKLKSYLQLAHGETIEKFEFCPLTGYCLDITLLEPVYEFLTGKNHQDSTLKDLIDMALSRALNEVDGDYEYQTSEEAFEEKSRDEDMYYDINGNRL